MKLKINVPSHEEILAVAPTKCNASNIERGDLEAMVVSNLYIKALIGEEKVLISSLAPDYDKQEILEIYENLMFKISNI